MVAWDQNNATAAFLAALSSIAVLVQSNWLASKSVEPIAMANSCVDHAATYSVCRPRRFRRLSIVRQSSASLVPPETERWPFVQSLDMHESIDVCPVRDLIQPVVEHVLVDDQVVVQAVANCSKIPGFSNRLIAACVARVWSGKRMIWLVPGCRSLERGVPCWENRETWVQPGKLEKNWGKTGKTWGKTRRKLKFLALVRLSLNQEFSRENVRSFLTLSSVAS